MLFGSVAAKEHSTFFTSYIGMLYLKSCVNGLQVTKNSKDTKIIKVIKEKRIQ